MAYVSQADKAALVPAIKAVMKKYDMKCSISVRHHSTLVVTVKSGAIDFSEHLESDDYIQVNTYWIDTHYEGVARNFLNELKAAMEGPGFYNNDDVMTDYFNRSHYVDINIGQWGKPYVHVKGTKINVSNMDIVADRSKPAYIVDCAA
jgi:hypothetical protein